LRFTFVRSILVEAEGRMGMEASLPGTLEGDHLAIFEIR